MNSGTFDGFGSPKDELRFLPILIARDEKTSGTNGGTSLTGFQTRTLNTVMSNTISGASLASNRVTLPSGTYLVFASAPARVGAHAVSLYNDTDSELIMTGTSEQNDSAVTISSRSFVSGVFTISKRKSIRLDHYITSGIVDTGLGIAVNTGYVEVYAEITLIKVA